MTDQQYCLRWNNHQPNFISVFKDLLQLEELVDVTLSVEGQHIKAHKVILSACSPYFKLLFTMTPSKHPIVILSDIKFVDLKTIIEFMYCGEINISDEQLADILEVAEVLQVRGLFDPNKKVDKNPGSSSKKRKRKTEIVGMNNVAQNDILQQHRSEAGSSGPEEAGSCQMFNPTEWLEVSEQSFNSECDGKLQPLLVPECTSFTSVPENMDILGHFDRSTPNIPQHIISPVSCPAPIRRRNSKVQESKNFLLALEAVRSGSLGFCKAAKLYGLNNRTLWLEYKKRGYPANRPPIGLRNKSHILSEKTS